MDKNLEMILLKSSLRVTKPRRAIFQTLKLADAPLSHIDIAEATPNVDKASVYRTVELFIELGIVIGVSHGWKQRYELADPFRPHHHHLHCTKCGKFEAIQSDRLEKIIHMLADESDFRITGHTFEVEGVCSDCQLPG